MTILLSEIVVLIVALIYTFFGYRLARILLPICGSALGLGLLIAIVPEYVAFVRTDQIIVAVSCIVSLYVLLFMFKRAAALVLGFVAAAFVCIATAEVFNVTAYAVSYPVMLTVCVISSFMCFVYRRIGVIVTTSLIGGAFVSLLGMVLINGGIDTSGIYEVAKQVADFFNENAVIITACALVFAAAGIFFQIYVSGKTTVLPSWGERKVRYIKKDINKISDRNVFV